MQTLMLLLIIPVALLIFAVFIESLRGWLFRHWVRLHGTAAVCFGAATVAQWANQGRPTVAVVLSGLSAVCYLVLAWLHPPAPTVTRGA